MSVEIEITRRGVYQGSEMLPVGTRLTLDKEPTGWVNKYRVVNEESGKTMEVATPAEQPKRRGRKPKRMSEEGATDGGDDNAY